MAESLSDLLYQKINRAAKYRMNNVVETNKKLA